MRCLLQQVGTRVCVCCVCIYVLDRDRDWDWDWDWDRVVVVGIVGVGRNSSRVRVLVGFYYGLLDSVCSALWILRLPGTLHTGVRVRHDLDS